MEYYKLQKIGFQMIKYENYLHTYPKLAPIIAKTYFFFDIKFIES